MVNEPTRSGLLDPWLKPKDAAVRVEVGPPPATPETNADPHDLYRAHFLRADAWRNVLVAAIALVGILAFIPNDRGFAVDATTFFALVAARAATVLAIVFIIVRLQRSSNPQVHDRLVSGGLFVFVGIGIYISSTRPPDYLGNGVSTLLSVSVVYFVMAVPLTVRAVTAFLLSLSAFWFIQKSPAPPAGLTAVAVAHVLMHVVGFPVARRLELSRKEAFFAQLDGQKVRAELARKASDLEGEKERALGLAKAKSDFLANMSHEFRTPMNAVLGLSGILADTPLSTEQRELIGTIHKSASSLLVLLNDILDLAKIDAGRMVVDETPFSLRDVMESSVEVVRYQAAQKSLILNVLIADEVPNGLAGDAVRLRQVLVNLLSNAVKFTQRGTISLRASARALDDDRHEVVVAVQDTGVGMAPELLARLFAPFEQSRESGSIPSSTGLGLAISKRLVELMGGHLRVSSRLGHGSTFEINLVARAQPLPVRLASRPEIENRERIQDLRILLVEDNLINQRVAQVMIQRLGARADIANNGREAVEATRRKPYDVILMDLRMPDMDGLEATKLILAQALLTRPLRILAMTASAFEDDRQACREAGMTDFISKPIQFEELASALVHAVTALPPVEPARLPTESGNEPTKPKALWEGGNEDYLSKDSLDTLRDLETADNPGFFSDVCQQFMVEGERILQQLEQALAKRDLIGANAAAHTLKSIAATVGASRLSNLCAAIETTTQQKRIPTDVGATEDLRVELANVRAALVKEAANSSMGLPAP